MKKKHLFCTKIWFYLTEIPLALLLFVACYYNFTSDNPWQFIPLIVILLGVMVFIAIYFFRIITVSYQEIRYHGLFSSRDSAIINKDKTLILTMRSRGHIGISLYGNDGRPPMFDGLRDEASIDIFLFRGKAVGGKRAIRSVLRYFEIKEEDIDLGFQKEAHEFENDELLMRAELKEDVREFRIKFKRTL